MMSTIQALAMIQRLIDCGTVYKSGQLSKVCVAHELGYNAFRLLDDHMQKRNVALYGVTQ